MIKKKLCRYRRSELMPFFAVLFDVRLVSRIRTESWSNAVYRTGTQGIAWTDRPSELSPV
jgi:hypothetical protein